MLIIQNAAIIIQTIHIFNRKERIETPILTKEKNSIEDIIWVNGTATNMKTKESKQISKTNKAVSSLKKTNLWNLLIFKKMKRIKLSKIKWICSRNRYKKEKKEKVVIWISIRKNKIKFLMIYKTKDVNLSQSKNNQFNRKNKSLLSFLN